MLNASCVNVCAFKWSLVRLVIFAGAELLSGSPIVMEILDHWQWKWTTSMSGVCVWERERSLLMFVHILSYSEHECLSTRRNVFDCANMFVSMWVCTGVFLLGLCFCVYWSRWSVLQNKMQFEIGIFFYHYVGNSVCGLLRRNQVCLQCLFLPLEDWWWWSVGYLRVKRFESHSRWLKLLKRQADNRLIFWAAKTQKSLWEPVWQKASPLLEYPWYLNLQGSALLLVLHLTLDVAKKNISSVYSMHKI